MKKIAFLLALALLVCALVPALAVTPAEIVGVWYLKSFEYNSLPAVPEGESQVEFKRDSTAVFMMNGEVEKEGPWRLTSDGAMIEGENYDNLHFYPQDDGTLKIEIIGSKNSYRNLVFTREKPEEIKLPAVVEAASEDAYFGTYALTLQKNGNILFPFENGGTLLSAKIEFAQVTISGESVGSEKIVMSDYQEGKVVLPAYGIVSGAKEENKMFIEKTETGIMVTCDAAPEMVYYLSPADATEIAAEPAEETAAEPAEEVVAEPAEGGAGE